MMPLRENMKLAWWKLACEKNPDPVAFVGLDDHFLFCNKAWCKLLGYAESELKERTWKDITKQEDIGADESETDGIKHGDKDDYYLEKTYIRRDKSEIFIKLYVHRYPESGNHEGYVVFAKRVTSEDYEDLKGKFLDLQKTVLILQQNAVASDFISNQIQMMEQKLEQNQELAKMAINHQGGNINIGDKTEGSYSGNNAGRDNNLSSQVGSDSKSGMNIYVILGALFMVMGLGGTILIGVIIYLLTNQAG